MSASIFPPESNASIPVDDAEFEPLPNGPMDLRQFLRMAIRITSALSQLHARDLIHRNIRPQNLRFHAPSGHVKLIGPSGAYTTSDPQREAEQAAQALPYMSPEQTEDMKRPTDHRSDLYSLGIVLYELASGKLPFHAEDPMGWVQCHLTIEPPPLTAVVPEFPQAVSDILSKLLEKTVEERYQSARGLLIDLETCLVELKAKGRIEPFPLGARDVWHGLRISAKLYGRETEVASLFTSFERVVGSGKPEIALVSGYSGIGKTSVVLALHKPIVRERGFFLSGKFDQHKRNIPYVTIAQAFREIIRQILTERTSQIELWRRRIVEALGANAQLIIDIIPQAEELIGKQPPVAELPVQDARNRFNTVFRSFLGVFAKREHPLVLFLDDLQYADFASLALLSDVITHPETKHLLVLGAYRDNEVSPSHPAIMTLEEIKKNGVEPSSVVLRPLEVEHLTNLVSDTFRFETDQARPLAALLHKKTGGNPFFANQFLAELHHENLVRFDVDNSTWQWDIGEIEAKEFTDDVVELMASKLRRLPGETQAALQLAACIGNEFDVEMLQVTHDKTPEETYEDLNPAVRGEFMLRRGNFYKFMHDRVHQAAYSLIPKEQVDWVHLRIGRLLLERTPERERDERVFDIVNQFNIGKVYVTEVEEQRSIATLNLAAGMKARASVAFRSAAIYLSAGISFLPEAAWETDYKLALDLHLALAECELLNGEFADSNALCDTILQRATSNADKSAAYSLKIASATTQGDNAKAIELGKEALKLFDIELIEKPSDDVVAAEIRRVLSRLNRPIESLLDLPLLTDPDTIAAMKTLLAVCLSLFFTDRNGFELLICRMVDISITKGNTDTSAPAYVMLGDALTTRFSEYNDSFRFGKLAYDLVEKHGYVAHKAHVCNVFASFLTIWTHHIRMNLEYSKIGWQAGIETGNNQYGCFNAVQTIFAMLLRGDPLKDVQRANNAVRDYIEGIKFAIITDVCTSVDRFVRAMQGLTKSFSTFEDDSFDQQRFETRLEGTIPVIHFWYLMLKLTAQYLSGDYEDGMAAANKANGIIWSAKQMAAYPEYCFFTAMTAAALIKPTSLPDPHNKRLEEYGAQLAASVKPLPSNHEIKQQEEYRALLSSNVEQLRKWSESCPENYLNKYSLAAAELARLEERFADAARLFEEAVRASKAHGFVQIEGLSNEVAARFHLGRGDVEKAHAHLREARDCYERWGAHGKVKHLEARYPDVLSSPEQATA
jgi:predicted ATPase